MNAIKKKLNSRIIQLFYCAVKQKELEHLLGYSLIFFALNEKLVILLLKNMNIPY